VLNRIGDRWTALIVLVLLDGSRRFTHLRTETGGISPKVLLRDAAAARARRDRHAHRPC
jgi:DNA-binding HxlR family transcriptional regulator